MKHVTLISLFLFITSCGNPHVSSVRDNIDRIVSPLTEEQCEEALSEARIYTDQEQYEAVAECQEQEQEQEQTQEQEEPKKDWLFETPVTQFGAIVPEVTENAIVTARDCNGSILIEEVVDSGTRYLGVTGPELKICEITLR